MTKYYVNDNWIDGLRQAQKIILLNTILNTIVFGFMSGSLCQYAGLPIYYSILITILSIISGNLFLYPLVRTHARIIKELKLSDYQIELTTSSFLWIKEKNLTIQKSEITFSCIKLWLYRGNSGNDCLQIKCKNKTIGFIMEDFFEDYIAIIADLRKQ